MDRYFIEILRDIEIFYSDDVFYYYFFNSYVSEWRFETLLIT